MSEERAEADRFAEPDPLPGANIHLAVLQSMVVFLLAKGATRDPELLGELHASCSRYLEGIGPRLAKQFNVNPVEWSALAGQALDQAVSMATFLTQQLQAHRDQLDEDDD